MTNLDVYHQLHCLRWVRKMIYPEYYKMHNGHEHNLGQHIGTCWAFVARNPQFPCLKLTREHQTTA